MTTVRRFRGCRKKIGKGSVDVPRLSEVSAATFRHPPEATSKTFAKRKFYEDGKILGYLMEQ